MNRYHDRLLDRATTALLERLGDGYRAEQAGAALNHLFSDDTGQPDLTGLATRYGKSRQLQGVVSSWLGEPDNRAGMAEALISSLFEEAQITRFCQELSLSPETAINSLACVLARLFPANGVGGGRRTPPECLVTGILSDDPSGRIQP